MTDARAAQHEAEAVAAATDPKAATAQQIAEATGAAATPQGAIAQVITEAIAGDPARRAAAAQTLVEVIGRQAFGVVRVLLPPAELQFCDADGHPFAGGTLEMYVVGTTTPKDTWRDAAGTVLNTNPIVLDAAGRALIYGDGGYRTILRDADGNLIWDQPSFTYVSSAMVPVVGAPTLADARHAMGIDDAIQVETDRALAAEAAEVIARNAAIAVETARAEAAEAAETAARIAADAVLQAEIDGGAVVVPPFQSGSASVGADGHARITFPVAFPSGSSAVVVTAIETGFVSVTLSVNSDRFGFDIWIMQAGTPIGKANTSFNWFATQD